VLSWNVEHFVDAYDDPYIDNAREDRPDSAMGNKVGHLMDALKRMDADVVVLEEFESAKFLGQLAQENLKDMGYLFFADAPSDTWYMNVVVMSKFPLGVLYAYGNVTTPLPDYRGEQGEPESQNQINTRMWSLEVFPAPDYEFILTGLHLKAGRGPRNEAMRLGQINFLKNQFDRFLEEDPSRNLLIAGDLNSTLGSREINALLKGDSPGSRFLDPLPKDILSHPADDPSRRLDYILPNGNMMEEYRMGSAKIPKLFNSKKMREISDHLPLLISFDKKDN
jgi:endonuclease/exonuclease/phosphatase family metal-dependent hydrolase